MKTIYIMGAGTSKEAGAPLMDEFFSEAEKILSHNTDVLKERFLHVLDFRRKNLPQSNIEELFSYLETISSMTNDPIFPKLKDDLIYLIGKVLEIKLHGIDFPIHKNFMENTVLNNEYVSSIISLNYDMLFDLFYISSIAIQNANGSEKSGINYGCSYTKFDGDIQNLKEIGEKTVLKLLKLHGSLNWLHCNKDNKLFSTLDGKVLHKLYEEPENRFRCPICKESLKPLLIPPSLTKLALINSSSPMRKIWGNAFHELVSADKVIIIGYSFPEADIHFKLFLQGALHRNVDEKKRSVKIDVITREKHGYDKVKFEDNYMHVFENLKRKVSIRFIYRNFGDYDPYE